MPRTLIVMLCSDHPEDSNLLLPSFQEIYGAMNVERQQAISVRPNGMWINALICDEGDNIPYVHTKLPWNACVVHRQNLFMLCSRLLRVSSKKSAQTARGNGRPPSFPNGREIFQNPGPYGTCIEVVVCR